jgi:hypothetical protein
MGPGGSLVRVSSVRRVNRRVRVLVGSSTQGADADRITVRVRASQHLLVLARDLPSTALLGSHVIDGGAP